MVAVTSRRRLEDKAIFSDGDDPVSSPDSRFSVPAPPTSPLSASLTPQSLSPELLQIEPHKLLTHRQVLALECLITRQLGETLESVAARAGLSRVSLYRYMEYAPFMEEFQRRVRMEFRSARLQVAQSLVRMAVSGDAPSQKLFWQLSGLLSETIEVNTGPPKNIESETTLDVDKMSPEARKMLLEEIKLSGKGSSEGVRREEERDRQEEGME